MKKKIQYILILTTFCTVALISLQGYWSFITYKQSGKSFKSDINNALKEAIAVDEELKRSVLLENYKHWLADTSLILITAKWNDQYRRTFFTIADKYPPANDQRSPYTLGLKVFTKKVDELNAEDKAFFIKHFVDDIIYKELEQGNIYFYTKKLGDLSDSALESQRLFPEELETLYAKQLSSYGIQTAFRIDTGDNRSGLSSGFVYTTKIFETGRRKPFIKVTARFTNPNSIIFQRMKWILSGSFLLIFITIFFFSEKNGGT
jgi:two-component system phosphate regulon sensor histidine kinase PhoR